MRLTPEQRRLIGPAVDRTNNKSLDFSGFDLIYNGAGRPAYHPRIPMKILIYGMLCKTRLSRKLVRACRENFVFMYLAEKVFPDFRTIARFRKANFGFREFLLRGLEKVKIEFNVC